MRVFQADYHTVCIETGALRLLLRYSLYQDDEERLPESISCEADTVVAYFLAATIRDVIDQTPHGFSVHRHWKILREGRFALAFTLDLPGAVAPPFLFPGAAAGARPPDSPLRVGETRSGYPNGLYLFAEPEGLLVFSDPESNPQEQGSVSLQGQHRPQTDEPAGLRVELRYPDATRPPGPAPRRRRDRGLRRGRGLRRDRGEPALPCLVSPGSLERTHRLNVVCAPRSVLRERATAAVLERLPPSGDLPDAAQLQGLLDSAVRSCLEERLVEQDGVCGLRLRAGAGVLSTRAGCGMALLLLRLYPGDAARVETALRLADFALKAQHPDGAFYDEYDLSQGVWPDSLPSAGGASSTGPSAGGASSTGPSAGGAESAGPTVAAETAAAVAVRLAQIAGLLSTGKRVAAGVQGARYLHAARHLADALIAGQTPLPQIGERLEVDGLGSTGEGLGGMAFQELYAELFALTGKDSYRKAWSALRGRFLAAPADAVGAAPDADAHRAVLRARLAALPPPSTPAAAGPRPAGGALIGPRLQSVQSAFSGLLPWVYLNAPVPEAPGPVGALVPVLGAGDLALRGFQTAYLLLALDRLLGKKRPLPVLRRLVARLIACTSQGPIGGSLPLPREERGAPARRTSSPEAGALVDELLYLQRLLAEFPGLFRRTASRGPRNPMPSPGAGSGPT